MGFWEQAKQQFMKDVTGKKDRKLTLEYVGGLPGFTGEKITLRRVDDVTLLHGQRATIKRVAWQEQHKRSAGKAAAGAIVGGLLTGGLGAIAGAAIGGRKRDSSLAVIQAEIDGDDCSITVRCSQDEYKALAYFQH